MFSFPWGEAMQTEGTSLQCPALEMLVSLSWLITAGKADQGCRWINKKKNKAVLAPAMWQQKYYWPSGKSQNLSRKKWDFQALYEEPQTLRINKLESRKYCLRSLFNVCKNEERECAGPARDVWEYNGLKCLSWKALELSHYMNEKMSGFLLMASSLAWLCALRCYLRCWSDSQNSSLCAQV